MCLQPHVSTWPRAVVYHTVVSISEHSETGCSLLLTSAFRDYVHEVIYHKCPIQSAYMGKISSYNLTERRTFNTNQSLNENERQEDDYK
jgi:hypothetical protein